MDRVEVRSIGPARVRSLPRGHIHMPEVVVVTGPRASGKTRWIKEAVRAWKSSAPARSNLVIDLSTTCVAANGSPGGSRWQVGCLCCSGNAAVVRHIEMIGGDPALARVVIETPALNAISLLGEIDATLGWPCSLIVCLSERWSRLRAFGHLSPSCERLTEIADLVIDPLSCGKEVDVQPRVGTVADQETPVEILY